MTRDELEGEANRIIFAAKAEIELAAELSPYFLLHEKSGWRRFPMPPGTEELMNSGEAKKALFGFLRETVRKLRIDATIFATDVWAGKITPEGMKHADELRERQDTGFETLVKLGWIQRTEAITLTAQRAEDVLVITQPYQRRTNGIQLDQNSQRFWIPQADFSGRQKMFGDLDPKNLGEQPQDRTSP